MGTGDDGLVTAAAAGDDGSFEALVRSHADAVWRFAAGMVGDAGAAEELTQDTFVRAHSRLASYRGDSTFRTWLLAICRSRCIDWLRLRRLDVVSLTALSASSVDDMGVVDLRLSVASALAALGTDDREAVTLVDVLGYSREEAAAIVGVAASTMRSRVSRAHRRLSTALDLTEADL